MVYTFSLTLNGETDVAYTASIAPWDSVYKNNTSPHVEGGLDNTGTPYRRVVGNGVDTLDVVYIAGNVAFDMGTAKAKPAPAYLGNGPVQYSVPLEHSYHIMTTEVTNAMYCKFLNDPNNHLVGTILTGTTGGNVDVSYWIPTTEVPTSTAVRLYQPATTNLAISWNGTTKQWQPAAATYTNYPITGVTWYGALAYARWAGGDLPAEAQWEYAARGGLPMSQDFISEDAGAGMSAFAVGAGAALAAVKSKLANGYGLFDMFGNVWELTYDRVPSTTADYAAGYSTATDNATLAVGRGGQIVDAYATMLIGVRYANALNTVSPAWGFRVVFNFEK